MNTLPRRIRKVAYLVGSFPEASETFIAQEAVSVQEQGVDVVVLHLRSTDAKAVSAAAAKIISTHRHRHVPRVAPIKALASLLYLLPRRPALVLRSLWALRRSSDRWISVQALVVAKWCLQQDVDFVHAHFADENFLYAHAVSGWTGLPYGVTTHRYDLLDEPLGRSRLTALLPQASALVTISDFNKKYMVQRYGLPAQAIHLVRCGIDLDRFSYQPQKVLRQADAPIRLLNVARLVHVKGQDVLIDALALVRKRGVTFSLDLIGGGPDLDALQDKVRNLGLQDCIFFHGAQPDTKVREHLLQADLFVLPSRSEGLPVVLIEACASGVPVLATAIFGIPELIHDGVTGLLVPVEDAQALAEKIVWASQNPQALQRMLPAARKKVETEFDQRLSAIAMTNIWESSAGLKS